MSIHPSAVVSDEAKIAKSATIGPFCVIEGRVEIGPGDTTVIDLTIGVPDDLAQSARYLAALPIALRTMLITVVPAGPEDGSK